MPTPLPVPANRAPSSLRNVWHTPSSGSRVPRQVLVACARPYDYGEGTVREKSEDGTGGEGRDGC